MALVESNMMRLGTVAPDFSLLDVVSNKNIVLSDVRSDVATVIVFICNHCPYVHHINHKLVEVANSFQDKGVKFIAISSNDVVAYPSDAPDKMRNVAIKEQYPFPYLYDESQEVAKAYKAECTPDFFVFDELLSCVYRGRFDDSNPSKGVVSGIDLSDALNAIVSGGEVSTHQFPSMGCSIKWFSN